MLIRLSLEDLNVVLRDMGSLLKWSAIIYFVPFLIGIWFREPPEVLFNYVIPALFSFFLGMFLKRFFSSEKETDLKHAFMTTSLIWLVFTAIAALPFMLIMGMGFVDAFFESMSSLTTTGLTMMNLIIDSAPKSLIFWRSFISWIGGVGIIVLSLMGIFAAYTKSARLLVSEGREEQIRPNLKNAAKEIWLIYLVLTALGAALLFFAGLGVFDAVNYSMSAISTTGMETSSLGLSGSNVWVMLSIVFIMIVGATPFSVHYLFLRKNDLKAHLKDPEFKVLVTLLIISSIIILPKMMLFYPNVSTALESTIFHATSALTCGGFRIAPISEILKWDDFVILTLMGLMVIGGASGSTAGGIKIARFIMIAKSFYWRIKEMILPKDSYFQKKFDQKAVDNNQIREVNQFVLLYIGLIFLGVFVLTLEGIPMKQALFAVISAQGNVGVEIGFVSAAMPLVSKIMLIFTMWIGRLEIIPLMAIIGFALSFKKA